MAEQNEPGPEMSFDSARGNLDEALEYLKQENNNFSYPSITRHTVWGDSKREKLRKVDELAGTAWDEFKKNSEEFREQNGDVVVAIKPNPDGENPIEITLDDLESEIDRFYPEGKNKAPATDEDFKSNTEDKIRLLTLYNQFLKNYEQFLKNKDLGIKYSPVLLNNPLDEERLFTKPKDYWITAEGWKRALDEDERGYKIKQSKTSETSTVTKDKSPERGKEFNHARENLLGTFEELQKDTKNFSDPSQIRHTTFGESKRGRLEKTDELTKNAWEEFKNKSSRFRRRWKNKVVGKWFDGEEDMPITLGDLEAEIDRLYPEGEYKAPATDEEFKANAEDKVRLLAIYGNFIGLKSKERRKVKPVSFVNPLGKGDLFAKPKDHWITTEGWIRDLDEDERGYKIVQPQSSVKKTEESEDAGGRTEQKTETSVVNEEPKVTTEDEQVVNDSIFILEHPREGANAYRLIQVDTNSDSDDSKSKKRDRFLFWKVGHQETFVEKVDDKGKKLVDTQTYKGPLKMWVTKDGNVGIGSKKKRERKSVWSFDSQVDAFVERFNARQNTEVKEFQVELPQDETEKSQHPEITETEFGKQETEKVQPAEKPETEENWRKLSTVNAWQLGTIEKREMFERSLELFSELRKLREGRDFSQTETELLDELEKKVDEGRENNSLGMGDMTFILSDYGKTLGFEY